MMQVMKSSFSAALLVFCLCITYGPAKASCIYNRTDHTIHVSLDCGVFCGNIWYINKGDHECRPGKGGTVYVNICNKKNVSFYCADECKVKVDSHGWVSVQQDGKTFISKSKHKDGSIREECKSRQYDD